MVGRIARVCSHCPALQCPASQVLVAAKHSEHRIGRLVVLVCGKVPANQAGGQRPSSLMGSRPARFEVLLSRGAEQDLESIYDYIAEFDGALNADHVLDELTAVVDALSRFPERGGDPKELVVLVDADTPHIPVELVGHTPATLPHALADFRL